jgi:MSHA biogenesis protein MshN
MSLINQVLKDLEKRHANAAERGAVTRGVRALPDDRSRRGLWIGAGVITIAIIAGCAWWWWTARSHDAELPITAKKPAAVGPIANVPTVPQSPQPAVSGAVAAPAPVNPATVSSAPIKGAAVPASAPSSLVSQTGSAPAETAPSPTLRPKSDVASAAVASPARSTAQGNSSATVTKPSDNAGTADPVQPTASANKSAPSPARDAAKSGSQAAQLLNAQPRAGAPKQRANPKPRALADAGPKVTASAQGVEYPDETSEAAQTDTNIAKQVRPQSERERAESSFRLGMNALQGGNVAEAEAALHEALRIDPLADKARQALLSIYVEAGRRDDAERLLEERLQLDRKHFGFAMALARLQLEHTSNGEALATLQRSLPYGENSADYQAMLANALTRVGRHKEAAERFAAASRLAPRNPLWQMGLGVELRADNRNIEARAAFQRARELGGLNAQLTAYLDQQLRELQ